MSVSQDHARPNNAVSSGQSPPRHWNVETAFAQIEKCSFECEGGPIANNEAYRWLKKALTEVGPKFLPGQGVFFEVVAEASGVSLTQWVHFYVVGVRMTSDTERCLWTYSLSFDPPAPWHYGTVHFTNVAEGKLRLEKPAKDAAEVSVSSAKPAERDSSRDAS